MAYHYINYRRYYVRFDETDRSFIVGREGKGTLLDGCGFVIYARDLQHKCKTIRPSDYREVACAHEKHIDGNGLSICFTGGPEEVPFLTIRILLSTKKVTVSLESVQDEDYFYDINGYSFWGEKPETDTYAVYSEGKERGLRCAVGPAAARGCDSLFDRLTDSLLTLTPAPFYHYDYEKGAWSFSVRLGKRAMSFELKVQENLLADRFDLPYKPMNNNTVFKRPPVGWMTWYAVKFDACEEIVLANSAIQKEKLKAYGANSIWVDWEWYHTNREGMLKEEKDFDTFHPIPDKYPRGLGYVADRIREDGFVPCVWIGASHDVRENDFLKKYPKALLVKRASWCGDYWFDPTYPAYLNEFLPEVFRTLTEKWGYEAIKWDALPRALDYFDQYHDKFYDTSVTSEQAMRNVVRKAREVVGEKVYMLSCLGEADRDVRMYPDVFDAARIGMDVFSWNEFLKSCVGRLLRYYPMHNVLQYCDPDNLVIREEFNTLDQAVSRASLLALLGTPITLGDDLRHLGEERFEIIRRAIPPLNAHPLILQEGELEKECLTVGCFVRTKAVEYQIADVFNLTQRPLDTIFAFDQLDLDPEEEYLVYDFWEKEFLGKVRHGLKLSLRPCQSKVFSIHRILDKPQLVATSRHITQGAFDVEEVGWEEEKNRLYGRSKTVPGEDYTLVAYDSRKDNVVSITLKPEKEVTEWEIQF